MPDYHFISVKHHHRDFFCGMIAEPHVAEWWGGPDHEWDLIVEGEETGASRGFIVHLNVPSTPKKRRAFVFLMTAIPNHTACF